MLPIPRDPKSWGFNRGEGLATAPVVVSDFAATILRTVILDTCAAVLDGTLPLALARETTMSRWERNMEEEMMRRGLKSRDYGCLDTDPRAMAWNLICAVLADGAD